MCGTDCRFGIVGVAVLAACGAVHGSGVSDGFESYPAGGYPGGGWQMRYNAVSDPANNKVVSTVSYSGSKSLQLYGKHGGCWAAEAGMWLPAWTEPYLTSGVVRPGNESGAGCHTNEAGFTFVRYYTSNTAPKAGGIGFEHDQSIGVGATVFTPGLTYTSYQWYHVAMGAIPARKRLFYTIDGRYVGSRDVPAAEWVSSFSLNLGSGDGIAWFDDVKAGRVGAAGPYLEPMSCLTDAIEDKLGSYAGPMNVPIPFTIIPQYVADIYSDAGVPISAALTEQCDDLADDKKWIGALCDVELTVTDPLGRYVDKDGGDLPGASYLCEDLDGDGDNEVCILLDASEYLMGRYTVEVTNPDPDNVETYSLFHYDPAGELLVPIITDGILTAGGSATHQFEPVPEPATWGLLALGALALMRRGGKK